MKCKVIGFTEFKKSSKSDSIGAWLYFAYDKVGVTGQQVDRVYVNVNIGLPQNLKVGEEVIITFDPQGYLLGIERPEKK